MSHVDFFSSSDRAELPEELHQAFSELGLGEIHEIEPTTSGALLSVRFDGASAGSELEAQAESLRVTLASLLTGGPELTFTVVAD